MCGGSTAKIVVPRELSGPAVLVKEITNDITTFESEVWLTLFKKGHIVKYHIFPNLFTLKSLLYSKIAL